MARLSSRAAPRHLVSTRRAPPSSPPRRGCCLAPMPAPAADPPGCVGGVRRWRPRFPLLTGSVCKFLYRETKRKAGPQPSRLAPWAHIS
ncbi:hypothetical protein Ctob_003238, partial [Chrysochromulina tobinii]